MLNIDGSVLEGGGQILRTAVALSAITGTAISITNIRGRRERTGLMPQHAAAVRAVAGMCHAQCSGLNTGSMSLEFSPGHLVRKDLTVDIGTAGSIPLVLHAWLPVALHTGGSVTVTGGTEVDKSPTIDYFLHINGEFLRHHGAPLSIIIKQRGYYPSGGGEVTVHVTAPASLDPLDTALARGPVACIFSFCSNLPAHVAVRQSESARKQLKIMTGKDFTCRSVTAPGPGAGSSITICDGWKGGTAVGRHGLPAEIVGKTAALQLVNELRGPGTVDSHLADQLLIYLAQYGGSYTAPELTLHSRTVCWLLDLFGYRIRIHEKKGVEFSL
jgi:RNA 3'-terminal phosphate cyclase (ATP)